MAVNFAALLKAAAPKTKLIELGELAEGSCVYLKELTAGERDSFWRANADGKAPDNIHSRLVALTMVDENGVRLCDGEEGYKQVMQLSSKVVQKLFEESTNLNKMTQDKVEEAAKNSQPTTSEDSTSV